MAEMTVRLLPYGQKDGAGNMAADEILLETATAGIASLRFYGWQEATLSLGYFQAAAVLDRDPRLTALPLVRRPTGGAALVHHHELTYALALPAAFLSRWGTTPWLKRLHEIISRALMGLGIDCRVVCEKSLPQRGGEGRVRGILCFQQFTPGDILCRGHKVAGSAQRKYRLCLLQHGALLLATSPYAPQLPGIVDLTGRLLSWAECQQAICQEFKDETGCQLSPEDWSPKERQTSEELAARKYSSTAWNRKR